MWIFVTMDFGQTKPGQQTKELFCRQIAKDGFSMLNRNTWVRYCSTQSNALMHRERVKLEIPDNSCVTLILVADKQCEYLYNHFGRSSHRKKSIGMPQPHNLIEFF